MKQGDIIKAYKIIRKIGGELEIPWDLKRKLADLRRQLQPVWDFQSEAEQTTIEALQAKFKKKPGETLGEAEVSQLQTELNSRLNELAGTEVEIEIQPIRIEVTEKMKKILNKILTGNELLDLDRFIEFEEGENK